MVKRLLGLTASAYRISFSDFWLNSLESQCTAQFAFSYRLSAEAQTCTKRTFHMFRVTTIAK